MLKKLFIAMLMGMITLGAMAQGGKFTVKGTFEGRKDSVTLEIVDVNSWETIVNEKHAITGEEHELTIDLKDAALLYVTDVKGLTTVFPAIPGRHSSFIKMTTKSPTWAAHNSMWTMMKLIKSLARFCLASMSAIST